MIDCKGYTDIEVIRLALDEPDYFVCLYNKYDVKLLRYVHRLAKVRQEDAEDILQDAFVKIWRNINDFDEEMKFSTWAYRIVHNETISFWRKQQSSRSVQTVELKGHEHIDDEGFGSIEEKEAAIQKVFDQLSENYRSILVLRFFEKLSYDEISDVLKIPAGTVAIRINRAKKAFAKIAKDKNINFFEE